VYRINPTKTMFNNQQIIPCPECRTGIPFNTGQLLAGHRFTCPGCGAVVALAEESREVATKTYNEFLDLKKRVSQ